MDGAFDDREVGRGADRRLHGLAVELAVGLRAGALDGGALGAVEQAELDTGGIGYAAHQAIEGVDFADKVAFAQSADCRVARHLADGGEAVGDESRARAHPGRGGGGFDARVAAADDDDVVGVLGRRHWVVRGLTGAMSVLLAENAERKSALPALTDSKTVKNPFHVKQGTESTRPGCQSLPKCFT